MKLEDQVCSLELAKNLKELGVVQESFFYWKYNVDFKSQVLLRNDQIFHNEQDYDGLAKEEYPTQSFSAFTVAELGGMMRGKGMGTTEFSTMKNMWLVAGGEWKKYMHIAEDRKEADARAKMLIWLLERVVKP